MWKPNVPSPSTANTGAVGSATRAAIAIGSELPIEPPTPLIMRRGGTGKTLWPHCANSPPSQISTVSGSRSTNGFSARNTSIACSLPGVFERKRRPGFRPLR